MENFNKPEASEEIELIILGLPTKKSPSPIGFTCELIRWLKKGISTTPAQTPTKKQKRKDYFPTHSLKMFYFPNTKIKDILRKLQTIVFMHI